MTDQAEDGYPVPNEEEYYQQRDPDGNGEVGNSSSSRRRARSPSVESQKMSKPMPKGSSFFIFSSKNRLGQKTGTNRLSLPTRVSDDEGQFEEDDIKREPSVNSLNKIVPIPDASAFFIFAAKNK